MKQTPATPSTEPAPDEGNAEVDWGLVGGVIGGVAGVIGGVVSGVALVLSWRAHRIALAADQRDQERWDRSRHASLRILSEHKRVEGDTIYLGLTIRNVGQAPALEPRLTMDYPPDCLGGLYIGFPDTLMPNDERLFEIPWDPPTRCFQTGPAFWGRFVVRYEDEKPHCLEALYELRNILPTDEANWLGHSRLRLTLDGGNHPQSVPEMNVEQREYRSHRGLLPPPGF